MITTILVDGFKTLSSFQLSFRPGLNILVGPNGSGKTNIVSFFEFLGYLMKTDASEATSRAGGAGAIFRKTETAYENRIKTILYGSVKAGPRLYAHTSGRELPPFLQYIYEFTLLFPETKDSVLFEKQLLKVRRVSEFQSDFGPETQPFPWGLEMEAVLDAGGRQKSRINGFNEELAYMPFEIFKSKDTKTPTHDIETVVDKFLEANISLVSTELKFETEFNSIGEDKLRRYSQLRNRGSRKSRSSPSPMNTIHRYTFVFWLLIAISAYAIDPVQDFLARNTFPTRNSKFDGQLFAGEWSNKGPNEPSGGYLFRFDVPMGINGAAVTFVTTSFRVEMRGSTWSAYSSDAQGNCVLLSDQVELANLKFYLSPANSFRGPMLSEVTSNKLSIFIKAFYLSSLGKWTEDTLESVERDVAKEEANPSYGIVEIHNLVQMKRLGVQFLPKVHLILLAEYLKNPSVKWRLSKDNHIYGQQADPDEKEHLENAKNFSQDDATRLWRVTRPAAASQMIP